MQKFLSISIVCFMIITIFSGCGFLQKLGLKGNSNDELSPVSSIVMNEEQAVKIKDKCQIRLYFTDSKNKKLRIEIRYIPTDEAKRSVNNLASIIVNQLIEGPDEKKGLKPTIPKGTKLKEPVKIDAGIATVNLSREFVDNHPGGKDSEKLTIYSVVNSLTELKEIQKVRFIIEGKTRKDFKGNFQFDIPFPRTPALISEEAPVSNIFGDEINNNKDSDTDKKADEKADKTTDKKDGSDTKEQKTPEPGGNTYLEKLE